MVSKCNRIASLVIFNYKIFMGEIPQTPPKERGTYPLSCCPPLVPSALGERRPRSMAVPLSKSQRRPCNTVTPVSLRPEIFRFQVYHSTTEPLPSSQLFFEILHSATHSQGDPHQNDNVPLFNSEVGPGRYYESILFIQTISYRFVIVQFLYNTPCYNMVIYDVVPNSFYPGILQRNFRENDHSMVIFLYFLCKIVPS